MRAPFDIHAELAVHTMTHDVQASDGKMLCGVLGVQVKYSLELTLDLGVGVVLRGCNKVPVLNHNANQNQYHAGCSE